MPTQLALRFADVPVSCEVQERYHAVAPCLAGKLSAAELAQARLTGCNADGHTVSEVVKAKLS